MYYGLGDTYEYDKNNNYTFSIPICGDFVAYYMSKVDIKSNITRELELICSSLYENEEYLKNKCETILVKLNPKIQLQAQSVRKLKKDVCLKNFVTRVFKII